MIKAGVIGGGHLGSIHLKLLNQSKLFELTGFYDQNTKISENLKKEFDYQTFHSINEVIKSNDAIFIATPTSDHFKIAKTALDNNKHIFIEKPITNTVSESLNLIDIANKNKLIGQVGHVERFNPAFVTVKNNIKNPKFIECHRLSEYPKRSTDVSVILDLMIHDIDIVLSVVDSKIKRILANGTSIISNSPDIANARIEFENGCIVNLTASRISLKKMRKSRFFQNDAYISIDYLKNKTELVKIQDYNKSNDYSMILENIDGDKKEIYYENLEIIKKNAIEEEHKNFANSILMKKKPIVDLNAGSKALDVAMNILSKIK